MLLSILCGVCVGYVHDTVPVIKLYYEASLRDHNKTPSHCHSRDERQVNLKSWNRQSTLELY